jgi:ataxia telangiectasia mutated family protein
MGETPDQELHRQYSKWPYEIPSDMLILKLNSVHVPVLTVNTPVDPALQYQNCIWISHYESTFETAGGVNIPKKYYCRGSGGAKCMQLVSVQSVGVMLR